MADPTVYVLARPQFDVSAVEEFLVSKDRTWRRTPDATPGEELIEVAGRVCYMSFGAAQSPKSVAEYVAHLIASGHESVLEHCSWTFLISDISRALTHQLVRHRIGVSFSQLSQQYHDEWNAEFLEPPNVRNVERAHEAWLTATQAAREAYRVIVESVGSNVGSGSGKEKRRDIRSVARSVLPNATATTMVMTANARAIRHILTVRGGIVGDREMRALSACLCAIVKKEAPAVFADFSIGFLSDGSPIVQMAPSGQL